MPVTDAAFLRIIEDTWNSTLGFQVDGPALADLPLVGTFTVCVKITGAWDGEVRLHCPKPLAQLIAVAFFQVEIEKVGSDEILDALSELIHIVGGNVKAMLPQPVTLSLPSLLDPADWAHTTPQWQMVSRLTLSSEGQPFVMAILGGLPAGAKDCSPSAWESSRPGVNL